MSLIYKHCINSTIDQITYYYHNGTFSETTNTSDVTKLIKYMPLVSPPFAYTWFDVQNLRNIPKDMVCGTFIKILQELSIRHGYGYGLRMVY